MKKVLLFVLQIIFFGAYAQNDYGNSQQLEQRINKLKSDYSNLVNVKTLTKTAGNKNIQVIEIGNSVNRDKNPALVIAGGVDGSSLLSVELAIGFAEKLLQSSSDDSIKQLLTSTTFYIFPNLSPDATDQYFSSLKYERMGNETDTDDDRDGRLNEDPYEDLNKDGWISMIRIEDPSGNWIKHPADDRIMIKANLEKGQRGNYLYLSEGIDNDKDDKYNEDGDGGVHFNKNFTFDYPYFKPGAGEFPVSEKETRAVLDYLYEHWNVFSVVTFGPANNLSTPVKYNAQKANMKLVSGIQRKDAKVNKLVSEIYNKTIKAKDAPNEAADAGDFMQWAYFHYGRYSFGTPGWWTPKFKIPKDSVQAAKYKKNEDKNRQVDFLRWAEKEGHDVFIPWKTVQHADFPGRKVEVGSFKPFSLNNPPYKYVSELSTEHNEFILKLAAIKPTIELTNLKTQNVDKDIYRITIDVYNSGVIPTLSDLGARNQWLKLVKAALELTGSQQLISGNRIELLPVIDGDHSHRLSWLVKGKGKVGLEVGAPHTGTKKIEIDLN